MTYLEFPTWDQWIRSLSAEELDVATALRNRFAALDDARVLRNLGAGPLLDAGADAGKLARFTQGVVGGVVHDLLYRLGYGSDQEVDESPLGGTLPGWRLVEVGPDGEPTGRPVDFLHESWG